MFGLKRIFKRFERNQVLPFPVATNTRSREPITGRCFVIDGDTIVIRKQKIRFAGINAPELNKPYGKQAKWTLVDLVKGQQITAHPTGETSYDRIVAKCFLPNGRDLAAEMVKLGLALDIPHFKNAKYKRFETRDSRRKLQWRPNRRFKRRRFRRARSNKILYVMFGIFLLALLRPDMFTITYLKNQVNDFIREITVSMNLEPQALNNSILSGTITHVRDGDTFEVNGVPVRISALDCPENSTTAGQKVTRFAKQFKGQQATCELTGAKTYDRVVGYCSINGKDFAQTMMDETSCKLWAKYDVWNRY